MNRLLPPALLGTALSLLTACASPPAATTVLVEHDRACPVRLQGGQTLIVNLPSDPTTGFRWQVEQSAATVLDSLGPEVFRSAANGVVGGEGVSSWRFQAARAGEDRLRLTYRQPWEPGAEPAAEFDCRIIAD